MSGGPTAQGAHRIGVQRNGPWVRAAREGEGKGRGCIRKGLHRFVDISSTTGNRSKSLSGGRTQEGNPRPKGQSRAWADGNLSEWALEEPTGRMSWLCPHHRNTQEGMCPHSLSPPGRERGGGGVTVAAPGAGAEPWPAPKRRSRCSCGAAFTISASRSPGLH